MKAGKEAGKEVMRPKKEGQKVADKQARIALGSGDVNKVKLIELLDMSTGSVWTLPLFRMKFLERKSRIWELCTWGLVPKTCLLQVWMDVHFNLHLHQSVAAEEIKEIHPDIKFVRTPRTAHSGKDKESIGWAYA